MFNRNNFEIAKLAADDDEKRPHLSGVYLTSEASYVTDGRLAIKVTVPELQPDLFPVTDGIEPADYFTPFLMDRGTALQVVKGIPKKGNESSRIVAVDCSTEAGETATVAVNENIRQSITRSRKGTAPYPEIDKVIPDRDSARFTISLDAELMAALMTQFAAFGRYHKSQSPQVVLRIYGPASAIRIDEDGMGQNMTAVLMPMRMTEPEVEG